MLVTVRNCCWLLLSLPIAAGTAAPVRDTPMGQQQQVRQLLEQTCTTSDDGIETRTSNQLFCIAGDVGVISPVVRGPESYDWEYRCFDTFVDGGSSTDKVCYNYTWGADNPCSHFTLNNDDCACTEDFGHFVIDCPGLPILDDTREAFTTEGFPSALLWFHTPSAIALGTCPDAPEACDAFDIDCIGVATCVDDNDGDGGNSELEGEEGSPAPNSSTLPETKYWQIVGLAWMSVTLFLTTG